MKKITLDFYGETIQINPPKDISSLRKEISEKFLFDPIEVLEILVSYIKDSEKKMIKSEQDFKTFLKEKISKISLEIEQESHLYQERKNQIKQQISDDKKKLKELKIAKEENKKKQETEFQKEQKLLSELNNNVKEISKKKLTIVKSITNQMVLPKSKENELEAQIATIEKKLDLPLIFFLPKDEPLPFKADTEEKKNLIALINKNTECIQNQEKQFRKPKIGMIGLDKSITNIHKQKLSIIKTTQKEIKALKDEELSLIKQIISLEKKLGLPIDEKMPYKKEGFYFPPNKTQTKNEKKELLLSCNAIENKLKSGIPNKNSGIIPKEQKEDEISKIINHAFQNVNKILLQEVNKTNENIEFIQKKSSENNIELKEEDQKYLEDSKKQNDKAMNEFISWMKYVEQHTKELADSLRKKNEARQEKINSIKEEAGKKDEESAEEPKEKGRIVEGKDKKTNIYSFKSDKERGDKTGDKKDEVIHYGIICDGCGLTPIVGNRFKCTVCNDFDYCEKCEEKLRSEHQHPFLKIYKPEMCPVEIKCQMEKSEDKI